MRVSTGSAFLISVLATLATISGGVPATTSNTFPAIDSTGSSGSCTLSMDQGAMTGTVQSNLNNIQDMTAAHLHIGPAGQNGPVVVPLYSGAPKSGTFSLTKNFPASSLSLDALGLPGSASPQDAFDALVKNQNNNNLYCNYHTKINPGGEIRGQL